MGDNRGDKMSKQVTGNKLNTIKALTMRDDFTAAVTTPPEYLAAYELIQRIDTHLSNSTGHFRTRDGVIIRTFDQAVNAILDGDFVGNVEPVTREQVVDACGAIVMPPPKRTRLRKRGGLDGRITLPGWMVE